MGWSDCGKDSRGRRIGYAYGAICDEPGCRKRIDRGLAYACGGMHGEDPGCEGYFCEAHLTTIVLATDKSCIGVCGQCAEHYAREGLSIEECKECDWAPSNQFDGMLVCTRCGDMSCDD